MKLLIKFKIGNKGKPILSTIALQLVLSVSEIQFYPVYRSITPLTKFRCVCSLFKKFNLSFFVNLIPWEDDDLSNGSAWQYVDSIEIWRKFCIAAVLCCSTLRIFVLVKFWHIFTVYIWKQSRRPRSSSVTQSVCQWVVKSKQINLRIRYSY